MRYVVKIFLIMAISLVSCAKSVHPKVVEMHEQYLLLYNSVSHGFDTLVRASDIQVTIKQTVDFWQVIRGNEIVLQGQKSKSFEGYADYDCPGPEDVYGFWVAPGLQYYIFDSSNGSQTRISGSLVDFDGTLAQGEDGYCKNYIVMSLYSY